MDTIPLNILIFISIPESILIIYSGIVLIGIRPEFKKVVFAGILQGFASYFIIRYIHFEANAILQYYIIILLTCMFFTWVIVKIKPLYAFLSGLLGMILMAFVQVPITLLAPTLTGLTLTEIMSRNWVRLIYSSPKLIIVTIIVYMCIKYNFTLEEEMKFLKKVNN